MNTNLNYFWKENTDDGIEICYWFNYNSQKLVMVTIDSDIMKIEVRSNSKAVYMWSQFLNTTTADAYLKITKELFLDAVNRAGSDLTDAYLMLKSNKFFNT